MSPQGWEDKTARAHRDRECWVNLGNYVESSEASSLDIKSEYCSDS